MKIKNLFSEIETSSEPVRTSNYVRYWVCNIMNLKWNMMHMECLLQLIAKFTPIQSRNKEFKVVQS